MASKKFYAVLFLSLLLIVSCPVFASAKPSKRSAAKARTTASAKQKQAQERSEAPSPLALGLDSIFITIKAELDEMVSSPLLHGKSAPPVNSYFLKVLKENQPFYSLTRLNQMGDVVNEMIRLVEKADEKKQNLSKELWYKQTAKKQTYFGMIKLEETGRYYLVWAVPIMDKNDKSKESFEGALALKIDLWDCFHKFANRIETPFLIRIDRLHLYSNKWKDTIAYKEEALSVPGVKKIFVRYPQTVTAFVTTPAPVVSETAAPAIDSTQIKAAAQDSIKALSMKKEADKKKAKKKTIFMAGLVLLIIVLAILLFIIVPALKQRAIMRHIDREET